MYDKRPFVYVSLWIQTLRVHLRLSRLHYGNALHENETARDELCNDFCFACALSSSAKESMLFAPLSDFFPS